MLNYKKWIAMLLTLCLVFNLIPLSAVAEVSPSNEIMEEDTVESEESSEATAEFVQETESEVTSESASETEPEAASEPTS